MHLPRAFSSVLGACTSVVLSIALAGTASAAPGDPIDPNDRASVVAAYQEWLAPQLGVPVGWTGSINGCDAGTTSAENQQATLSAVNYMRAMAGLAPVSWEPSLVGPAQAAALVMAANGQLSHTPPRDWACWTEEAYRGASHSNIGLTIGGPSDALNNTTGARVVVLYMADAGDNNTAAGHRRWLLYQRLAVVGSGDTNTSNALYVLPETLAPRTRARIVSWPTAGFFPRELEPDGRWSLTYPGADFSRAKVSVTAPTGPVRVTRYRPDQGIGDNTLVWHADIAAALQDPGVDVPVVVSVRGVRVKGKTMKPIRWTTTFVKAS